MATKEVIQEALQQLGNDQTPEMKQAVEKLTQDLFEKDLLPKEAMGLTESQMEGMYGFGYRLYNSGKYEEAIQLFRLLMLVDPGQPKYMLGLAASYHMMKDYHSAATLYTLCSLVDDQDPLSHYHASDCYIEMQKNDLATQSLEQCIKRCQNKPEFLGIQNRAQVLLEAMKNKTGESP